MKVWTWEAEGAAKRAMGVCQGDAATEAIQACEELIRAGEAQTAKVELVEVTLPKYPEIDSDYIHTGHGWSAAWNPDAQEVTWADLTPSKEKVRM